MPKQWKYLYICFSIFLLFTQAYAQPPIILDATNEKIVTRGFTYFPDSAQSLPIKKIAQLYTGNKFLPAVPGSMNPDYQVYWLHFSLKNITNFDREYILDFQNWSFVDLYEVNNGTITQAHKTGHLYPYAKRDYPIANKAYILLPIKSGEVVECFVRLQSEYNNELVPADLGFTVSPRFITDNKASLNGKIIFSFLAVFLFMFLYTFFIFISTRLISFALYLVVIFFAFYHTAYNSGYIIPLFKVFDSFPVLLTYFETVSSNLYAIAGILFINEFFKVKERYPGWYKIIKYLLIGLVVTGVVLFLHAEIGMILSSVVGLATITTILCIAIKSVKDKYPASEYLLIGYLASCISAVIIILCLSGIIPKTDWTFVYSMPIGSSIEIIFFSFALANMINVLRKENEAMQLHYQQEIFKTQLEIQEQTFQNIGNEIHDNIGQVLGLVKLKIYKIERLLPPNAKDTFTETKYLIDKVINDLRDLSKTLNTDYINQIGLVKAIEQQLKLLDNTDLYKTEILVRNEGIKFDSQRELVIFRIVQELLNNIVKHAEATTIQIIMDYQVHKLVITVKDNGRGFNQQLIQEQNNQGQGLQNILRRIDLINGRINIESQPNRGTTVTIVLTKQDLD